MVSYCMYNCATCFFWPNMFLIFSYWYMFCSSSFTLTAAWILYDYSTIHWSVSPIGDFSILFLLNWNNNCSKHPCIFLSPDAHVWELLLRDNVYVKCFNTLQGGSPLNWTNILIVSSDDNDSDMFSYRNSSKPPFSGHIFKINEINFVEMKNGHLEVNQNLVKFLIQWLKLFAGSDLYLKIWLKS